MSGSLDNKAEGKSIGVPEEIRVLASVSVH